MTSSILSTPFNSPCENNVIQLPCTNSPVRAWTATMYTVLRIVFALMRSVFFCFVPPVLVD